jgi:hypothetical protein
MRFDGRKQLAHFRTGGNHFGEAVQLLAARFAVDVTVLMFVKYRLYEFMELLVHCVDPVCFTLYFGREIT